VREYQEQATSELERSDELLSRKGTALSQVAYPVLFRPAETPRYLCAWFQITSTCTNYAISCCIITVELLIVNAAMIPKR
jgi:hypothetical protein